MLSDPFHFHYYLANVISMQETERQQTDWKDTERTYQIGEPKDPVSLLCDPQNTFLLLHNLLPL